MTPARPRSACGWPYERRLPIRRLPAHRRVFRSAAGFAPMYPMLLFENLTLRYVCGRANLTVMLIVFQLSSIAISDMGFNEFLIPPTGLSSDTGH
jgi:hypothetical protein